MSRKRLVGGMAVNLMPCRKGSSVLSRLRYAVPPIGCTLQKPASHQPHDRQQPNHSTLKPWADQQGSRYVQEVRNLDEM